MYLHRRIAAVLGALVVFAANLGAVPCALADPELDVTAPGDPSPTAPSADPIDGPSLDQQDAPPTVHPANGATVGIAMPIVINFSAPVTDQGQQNKRSTFRRIHRCPASSTG